MTEPSERSMEVAERLEQVAEIVSAYVSNSALSVADRGTKNANSKLC